MLPALVPVTLIGQGVELHPLSFDHESDLSSAIGDLHTLLVTTVPSPETIHTYIAEALTAQASGTALPFALIEPKSRRAIGSTRFLNIRSEHGSVEIGGTWISAPWQRTAVNTEAKYQLFTYGFEKLGCLRIELKTDLLNERSQRAIERLGARREGIFRKHMVTPNGRVRDTVYYSVIDTDWPAVKAGLEAKLQRA